MSLTYGVATISRLLKILGLFCKRALQKRLYSAKESYNFKEPTIGSHPIASPQLRTGVQVLEPQSGRHGRHFKLTLAESILIKKLSRLIIAYICESI